MELVRYNNCKSREYKFPGVYFFKCLFLDGHIHGLLGGEDSYLTGIFHRIVEVEESDRETIHLMVFLFMQFLSRYNRGVNDLAKHFIIIGLILKYNDCTFSRFQVKISPSAKHRLQFYATLLCF